MVNFARRGVETNRAKWKRSERKRQFKGNSAHITGLKRGAENIKSGMRGGASTSSVEKKKEWDEWHTERNLERPISSEKQRDRKNVFIPLKHRELKQAYEKG